MQKATFLFVLLAVAFQTAMAQTPKIKMTIQEIITRPGVWEANPEATFRYHENLYRQKGLEEKEADKIITKTTDAFFMFRDNMLWHYGETRFGQAVFAKLYFQVDEVAQTIKMYQEATLEGKARLTFQLSSIDEKRLIFFIEEEKMFFVCDYTTDKKKFLER